VLREAKRIAISRRAVVIDLFSVGHFTPPGHSVFLSITTTLSRSKSVPA